MRDSLFKGQFWVKADTHTFVDGKHEMKLELEFENIMNEEETEKEKEEEETEGGKKRRGRGHSKCGELREQDAGDTA